MKKKIGFVFFIMFFAVTISNWYKHKGSSQNLMLLNNIEALASEENDTPTPKGYKMALVTQQGTETRCIKGRLLKAVIVNVDCIGEGDIDCTSGSYVSSVSDLGPCASV